MQQSSTVDASVPARTSKSKLREDNLTWEDFSLDRFKSQSANRFPQGAEPPYVVSIYDIRPEKT